MSFLKKCFSSRKFVVSVSMMTTVIFNHAFGWEMSPETIQNILLAGSSFIIGQGAVDTGLALKGKYGK